MFESINPMAKEARDKGQGKEGGVGKSQRKKSNWKKAVNGDGNEYSYDEKSGGATWSDRSQADEI